MAFSVLSTIRRLGAQVELAPQSYIGLALILRPQGCSLIVKVGERHPLHKDIQLLMLGILKHLSTYELGCRMLVEAGAIETILNNLKPSQSPEKRNASLTPLAQMALMSLDARHTLQKRRNMQLLHEIMDSCKEDVETQTTLCMVFCLVSVDSKGAQEVVPFRESIFGVLDFPSSSSKHKVVSSEHRRSTIWALMVLHNLVLSRPDPSILDSIISRTKAALELLPDMRDIYIQILTRMQAIQATSQEKRLSTEIVSQIFSDSLKKHSLDYQLVEQVLTSSDIDALVVGFNVHRLEGVSLARLVELVGKRLEVMIGDQTQAMPCSVQVTRAMTFLHVCMTHPSLRKHLEDAQLHELVQNLKVKGSPPEYFAPVLMSLNASLAPTVAIPYRAFPRISLSRKGSKLCIWVYKHTFLQFNSTIVSIPCILVTPYTVTTIHEYIP